MQTYNDCSLCGVTPRGGAFRCRFCSGKLTGRDRLIKEIYDDTKLKHTGTFLSSIAAGLGQMLSNRWLTGLVFAVLIPLCLGLLYVTFNGFTYSHLFILGAALFTLLVAGADSWFGPTQPEPPCRRNCPSDVPIPDYLQLIIDEGYDQGYSFIKTHIPVPGVIGRICPHPCETACYRGVDGEPIAINACKRYLADRVRKNGKPAPEAAPAAKPVPPGPRVAIVGSGPSGLSCAYYLAILGARPVIFDYFNEAGGRLVTTIPDFRLPKEILREEVAAIVEEGTEIRTGVRIGPGGKPISELFEEFDAVYLAIGAPKTVHLGIAGQESFTDFQEFLEQAKTVNRPALNGKVAVIGGGNAAIDVCRTALRCGADEVHLLYRRERDQMPARDDEVEAAMREGVNFHYLINPVRAVLKDGQLKGVVVSHMELTGVDESGRPKPVPIPDSDRMLDFSAVIPCLGQENVSEIFEDPVLKGIHRDRQGRVITNGKTGRTSIKRIYAGGDMVRGASTAVAAIADGRKAALAIYYEFARGNVKAVRWRNLMKRKPFPGHSETEQEKIREEMRTAPIRTRTSNFNEVEEGFFAGQALRESRRCLQCHREI